MLSTSLHLSVPIFATPSPHERLTSQAACKYVTTGHWAPGGMRPAEECWVNNAAMAVVRRELQLRRAVAGGGGGSSAPGTPRSGAVAAAAAGGGGGGSGRGSPAVMGAGAGGGGGSGGARGQVRPASAGGRSGSGPAAAAAASGFSPTKRMSLVGVATGVPEMDDQVGGREGGVVVPAQTKPNLMQLSEEESVAYALTTDNGGQQAGEGGGVFAPSYEETRGGRGGASGEEGSGDKGARGEAVRQVRGMLLEELRQCGRGGCVGVGNECVVGRG